jgi:hypothetical protein
MKSPMHELRLALSLLALAGCQIAVCSVAHASEPVLAQSPALACLTRMAGAPPSPEYPPEHYRRKEGRDMQVELTFRSASEPPAVRYVNDTPEAAFFDAVNAFAQGYRVPCLAPDGPPVVLRQQYRFIPNDGRKIVSSAPIDRADVMRKEQLSCITSTAAQVRPEYPQEALRRELEEKMVLHMRFTAPDQPPLLTWTVPPQSRAFHQSVERYANTLRMPCLHDGPVETDQLFAFVIDGSARTVLRDTTLVKLLAISKNYAVPAFFDFNTMACPFDVRMNYLRPWLPNKIHELENSLPARKPLLEWMRDLTLPLDDASNRKVLGDTMTVTIPCGELDL